MNFLTWLRAMLARQQQQQQQQQNQQQKPKSPTPAPTPSPTPPVLISPPQATRTAPAPSGGGGVTPIVDIDFTEWANTAALLADNVTWWTGEQFATGEIQLDTVNHKLNFNWLSQGVTCAVSHKISPGDVRIPSGNTHLWWERILGWNAGWTTNAGAGGCAPEYKQGTFGDVNGGGRGNDPEMQPGQIAGGPPGNESAFVNGQSGGIAPSGGTAITLPVNPSTWWGDGLTHTTRTECRLSASGNTGIWKFGIDGKLYQSWTGFNTDPGLVEINYVSLGQNMNQGPASTQTNSYYRIRVYNQDPGWVWT